MGENVIVITGSSGLIGSEACHYFVNEGYEVVGVDNDMRATFFGEDASTKWAAEKLKESLKGFQHRDTDIRDAEAIDRLFNEYGGGISAVIHTAAQPSHDWAAKDPKTDFSVNATGTLNLLEATRQYAPEAAFVFTSTNKVYGDRPNTWDCVEEEDRYEVYTDDGDPHPGVDEMMSVDQSKHSLFGVSKLAADLLVQEYGKYFGIKSSCFRGGCLTGGGHSGTELHGFLSYLMRCTMTGKKYRIFGYKGKQVRDNIHSSDLVKAFHAFIREPRVGAVYNIGGGRFSNCSMKEAVKACEERSGKRLDAEYVDEARKGDHRWYISDLGRFRRDYPDWAPEYTIEDIFDDIYEDWAERIKV